MDKDKEKEIKNKKEENIEDKELKLGEKGKEKKKAHKDEQIPRELMGLFIDMDWCKEKKTNKEEKSKPKETNGDRKGHKERSKEGKEKIKDRKEHEKDKSKDKNKKKAKSLKKVSERDKNRSKAPSKEKSKKEKVKEIVKGKKKEDVKVSERDQSKSKDRSKSEEEKSKVKPEESTNRQEKRKDSRQVKDERLKKQRKLDEYGLVNKREQLKEKAEKKKNEVQFKEYHFEESREVKQNNVVAFYQVKNPSKNKLEELAKGRGKIEPGVLSLFKGLYAVNRVKEGRLAISRVNEINGNRVSKYVKVKKHEGHNTNSFNEGTKSSKGLNEREKNKNHENNKDRESKSGEKREFEVEWEEESHSCMVFEDVGLYVEEEKVNLCVIIKRVQKGSKMWEPREKVKEMEVRMIERISCNTINREVVKKEEKKPKEDYLVLVFNLQDGVFSPSLKALSEEDKVKRYEEAKIGENKKEIRILRSIIGCNLNMKSHREEGTHAEGVNEIPFRFCHANGDQLVSFEGCCCLACQLTIQILTNNSTHCPMPAEKSAKYRQFDKNKTCRIVNILKQVYNNDNNNNDNNTKTTNDDDRDKVDGVSKNKTLDTHNKVNGVVDKDNGKPAQKPKDRTSVRLNLRRGSKDKDETDANESELEVEEDSTLDSVQRTKRAVKDTIMSEQEENQGDEENENRQINGKEKDKYNNNKLKHKDKEKQKEDTKQTGDEDKRHESRKEVRVHERPKRYITDYLEGDSEYEGSDKWDYSDGREEVEGLEYQIGEGPHLGSKIMNKMIRLRDDDNRHLGRYPAERPVSQSLKLIMTPEPNAGFRWIGYLVKYSKLDRDPYFKKGRSWRYAVIKYWDPKYRAFFIHELNEDIVRKRTEPQIFSKFLDFKQKYSESVRWITTHHFFIVLVKDEPVFNRRLLVHLNKYYYNRSVNILNFEINDNFINSNDQEGGLNEEYQEWEKHFCKICKKRILLIRRDYKTIPKSWNNSEFDEEIEFRELINEMQSTYDYPNMLFRNPVHSTVLALRELEQIGKDQITRILESNLDITIMFFEKYDRNLLNVYSKNRLYHCIKLILWMRKYNDIRERMYTRTPVKLIYWGFKCEHCNEYFHAKCLQYQHLRKPQPQLEMEVAMDRLNVHKRLCKNFRVASHMRKQYFSNENLFVPTDFKIDTTYDSEMCPREYFNPNVIQSPSVQKLIQNNPVFTIGNKNTRRSKGGRSSNTSKGVKSTSTVVVDDQEVKKDSDDCHQFDLDRLLDIIEGDLSDNKEEGNIFGNLGDNNIFNNIMEIDTISKTGKVDEAENILKSNNSDKRASGEDYLQDYESSDNNESDNIDEDINKYMSKDVSKLGLENSITNHMYPLGNLNNSSNGEHQPTAGSIGVDSSPTMMNVDDNDNTNNENDDDEDKVEDHDDNIENTFDSIVGYRDIMELRPNRLYDQKEVMRNKCVELLEITKDETLEAETQSRVFMYYPMLDCTEEAETWKCPDCKVCMYCCTPMRLDGYQNHYNYSRGYIEKTLKPYKQFPRCFENKVDQLQRNLHQSENSKEVVCVSCNITAHRRCCNPVVPNLLFIESWKCDFCTQCISCGYRDHCCVEYLNWGLFFLFCLKCWELLERTNYCGICYKVWTNFDSNSQKWVQCEGCKLWIHVECDELARLIMDCQSLKSQNYRCNICRVPDKTLRCMKLLEQIFVIDKLNQFRYPVSPTFVTYWRLVTRPMNLVTLYTKLECGKYKSYTEFIFDSFLISHNAKMVNMPNTKIYRFAIIFERKLRQLVTSIMQISDDEIDAIVSAGLNGGDFAKKEKLVNGKVTDNRDKRKREDGLVEDAAMSDDKESKLEMNDELEEEDSGKKSIEVYKKEIIKINLSIDSIITKILNIDTKIFQDFPDTSSRDAGMNKENAMGNDPNNRKIVDDYKRLYYKKIGQLFETFVPCGMNYAVSSSRPIEGTKFIFSPTYNRDEDLIHIIRNKNLVIFNKNKSENVYIQGLENKLKGIKSESLPEFYLETQEELDTMSSILFSEGYLDWLEACVVCGSTAYQKNLIHCVECAEPIHYYCAGLMFGPQEVKYSKFKCGSCSECERCKDYTNLNHPYEISNINNFHFGDGLGFMPTIITNVVLHSAKIIEGNWQNQQKKLELLNLQEADVQKMMVMMTPMHATFLDGRFRVDRNGLITSTAGLLDFNHQSKFPFKSVKCIGCGKVSHLGCVKVIKPPTNPHAMYSKHNTDYIDIELELDNSNTSSCSSRTNCTNVDSNNVNNMVIVNDGVIMDHAKTNSDSNNKNANNINSSVINGHGHSSTINEKLEENPAKAENRVETGALFNNAKMEDNGANVGANANINHMNVKAAVNIGEMGVKGDKNANEVHVKEDSDNKDLNEIRQNGTGNTGVHGEEYIMRELKSFINSDKTSANKEVQNHSLALSSLNDDDEEDEIEIIGIKKPNGYDFDEIIKYFKRDPHKYFKRLLLTRSDLLKKEEERIMRQNYMNGIGNEELYNHLREKRKNLSPEIIDLENDEVLKQEKKKKIQMDYMIMIAKKMSLCDDLIKIIKVQMSSDEDQELENPEAGRTKGKKANSKSKDNNGKLSLNSKDKKKNKLGNNVSNDKENDNNKVNNNNINNDNNNSSNITNSIININNVIDRDKVTDIAGNINANSSNIPSDKDSNKDVASPLINHIDKNILSNIMDIDNSTNSNKSRMDTVDSMENNEKNGELDDFIKVIDIDEMEDNGNENQGKNIENENKEEGKKEEEAPMDMDEMCIEFEKIAENLDTKMVMYENENKEEGEVPMPTPYLDWDFDGSGLFKCTRECELKYEITKLKSNLHERLFTSSLLRQFDVLQDLYDLIPLQQDHNNSSYHIKNITKLREKLHNNSNTANSNFNYINKCIRNIGLINNFINNNNNNSNNSNGSINNIVNSKPYLNRVGNYYGNFSREIEMDNELTIANQCIICGQLLRRKIQIKNNEDLLSRRMELELHLPNTVKNWVMCNTCKTYRKYNKSILKRIIQDETGHAKGSAKEDSGDKFEFKDNVLYTLSSTYFTNIMSISRKWMLTSENLINYIITILSILVPKTTTNPGIKKLIYQFIKEADSTKILPYTYNAMIKSPMSPIIFTNWKKTLLSYKQDLGILDGRVIKDCTPVNRKSSPNCILIDSSGNTNTNNSVGNINGVNTFSSVDSPTINAEANNSVKPNDGVNGLNANNAFDSLNTNGPVDSNIGVMSSNCNSAVNDAGVVSNRSENENPLKKEVDRSHVPKPKEKREIDEKKEKDQKMTKRMKYMNSSYFVMIKKYTELVAKYSRMYWTYRDLLSYKIFFKNLGLTKKYEKTSEYYKYNKRSIRILSIKMQRLFYHIINGDIYNRKWIRKLKEKYPYMRKHIAHLIMNGDVNWYKESEIRPNINWLIHYAKIDRGTTSPSYIMGQISYEAETILWILSEFIKFTSPKVSNEPEKENEEELVKIDNPYKKALCRLRNHDPKRYERRIRRGEQEKVTIFDSKITNKSKFEFNLDDMYKILKEIKEKIKNGSKITKLRGFLESKIGSSLLVELVSSRAIVGDVCVNHQFSEKGAITECISTAQNVLKSEVSTQLKLSEKELESLQERGEVPVEYGEFNLFEGCCLCGIKSSTLLRGSLLPWRNGFVHSECILWSINDVYLPRTYNFNYDNFYTLFTKDKNIRRLYDNSAPTVANNVGNNNSNSNNNMMSTNNSGNSGNIGNMDMINNNNDGDKLDTNNISHSSVDCKEGGNSSNGEHQPTAGSIGVDSSPTMMNVDDNDNTNNENDDDEDKVEDHDDNTENTTGDTNPVTDSRQDVDDSTVNGLNTTDTLVGDLSNSMDVDVPQDEKDPEPAEGRQDSDNPQQAMDLDNADEKNDVKVIKDKKYEEQMIFQEWQTKKKIKLAQEIAKDEININLMYMPVLPPVQIPDSVVEKAYKASLSSQCAWCEGIGASVTCSGYNCSVTFHLVCALVASSKLVNKLCDRDVKVQEGQDRIFPVRMYYTRRKVWCHTCFENIIKNVREYHIKRLEKRKGMDIKIFVELEGISDNATRIVKNQTLQSVRIIPKKVDVKNMNKFFSNQIKYQKIRSSYDQTVIRHPLEPQLNGFIEEIFFPDLKPEQNNKIHSEYDITNKFYLHGEDKELSSIFGTRVPGLRYPKQVVKNVHRVGALTILNLGEGLLQDQNGTFYPIGFTTVRRFWNKNYYKKASEINSNRNKIKQRIFTNNHNYTNNNYKYNGDNSYDFNYCLEEEELMKLENQYLSFYLCSIRCKDGMPYFTIDLINHPTSKMENRRLSQGSEFIKMFKLFKKLIGREEMTMKPETFFGLNLQIVLQQMRFELGLTVMKRATQYVKIASFKRSLLGSKLINQDIKLRLGEPKVNLPIRLNQTVSFREVSNLHDYRDQDQRDSGFLDLKVKRIRQRKQYDMTNASTQYRYLVSLPPEKRLDVKPSVIHGLGLFTSEYIPAGEPVVEYVGELIRDIIGDQREEYYSEGQGGDGSCYMFRLDEQLIVDATTKGNMSRFINHSCDPNCLCRIITCENGLKHIVVFAKVDLLPGDEVTYDYQFGVESETRKLTCLCGAPNCLGRMN